MPVKRTTLVIVLTALLVVCLVSPAVAADKYSMFSVTSWTPKSVSKSSTVKITGWEWYGTASDKGPVKRTFVAKKSTKYYFAYDGVHVKPVSRTKFFSLLKKHKQVSPTNGAGYLGNVYWKWARGSNGKRYRKVSRIEANLWGE